MKPKSPWNPSKRATERVTHPLPAPTHCPHCGSLVEIVSHTTMYGRPYSSWPWLYRCTDQMPGVECDARIGIHPFTAIPVGTMATEQVRQARTRAHTAFDPLWRGPGHSRGRATRLAAYAWLAEAMGLPVEHTHIGLFGIEQCEQVVQLCEARTLKVAA